MSEQQIGRSPFAVIAELASVTVIAFYLYDFSFFHGFMAGIDRQFLALFSAKDVIDFLPWSLVWYVFFLVGSAVIAMSLLWPSYFEDLVKRALPSLRMPSFSFVFLRPKLFPSEKSLLAFFSFIILLGPIVLIIGVATGDILGNDLSNYRRSLFVSIATCACWNALAIILIIWSMLSQRGVTRLARSTAYILFLISTGFGAYGSGIFYFYENFRKTPFYCIMMDQSLGTRARLLIASDQNALFELETGELRALSFNAIKSISNRPCAAPAEVKGK